MQLMMAFLITFLVSFGGVCCEEPAFAKGDHKSSTLSMEVLKVSTSDHTDAETPAHHCEAHCSQIKLIPSVATVPLLVPSADVPRAIYSFLYAEPGVDVHKRPPVDTV